MRGMNGLLLAMLAAATATAGCFRPPLAQPPLQSKGRAVIGVPYDLTWDAIHEVIKKNKFKVQADDPDHGIVEAEATSFSLAEADCGQIRSIIGSYSQEPGLDATAVYRFQVEPSGGKASVITVDATFSAPVHVPLRQPRDFQCVSRGTAETRLLKEVEAQARAEHRPSQTKSRRSAAFGAPAALPVPAFAPLTPGRPTLLRPGLAEPKLQ